MSFNGTTSSAPDQTETSVVGSRVDCKSVSVVFGGNVRALDAVNLTADPGEILTLVGPSGCGKTTLLRLIAGLQVPTSGQLEIQPPAQGAKGEVGFVFQQPELLKWRTSLGNVALPLELGRDRYSKQERLKRARSALQQVELVDAAGRFPHQLSGGMQMRVSIARALVTSPKLLLLDEPFAALDDMLRNQLGGLLLDLWATEKFTAVLVTHNIAEAVMLSHRVAVIRNGRVESVIENTLPWPRTESLRRSPGFGEMYGRVSDALRGQL